MSCFHNDVMYMSQRCISVPTRGFPVVSSWSLVRRSSRVLVRMLSLSLPLLEPLSTWAFHSLYSSKGAQRRNLMNKNKNKIWFQNNSYFMEAFLWVTFYLFLLEQWVHVQQVVLDRRSRHSPACSSSQLTHSLGGLDFGVFDVVGFVQDHSCPVDSQERSWAWRLKKNQHQMMWTCGLNFWFSARNNWLAYSLTISIHIWQVESQV